MSRQRPTDENSKLFEFLQNDLKSLSIETKKKFPHIKEVRILVTCIKIVSVLVFETDCANSVMIDCILYITLFSGM